MRQPLLHKNGTKKGESVWIRGKKTGKHNLWDETGKLIKIFYYKDDEKIKELTLDPKTGKMVVTFEMK